MALSHDGQQPTRVFGTASKMAANLHCRNAGKSVRVGQSFNPIWSAGCNLIAAAGRFASVKGDDYDIAACEGGQPGGD